MSPDQQSIQDWACTGAAGRRCRGLERSAAGGYLWDEIHAYAELPRVLDPPTGWLQNANDPPWTTTLPPVLDPDDYPAYMAPRGWMGLRSHYLLPHYAITLQSWV